MSVSLPPVLGAGDRVRFGGQVRVVTRLDAEGACLDGAARAVPLAELFADPGFAVLSAPRPAPLSPEGLLECLPARVAEHARWLEVHVAEVVTGVPAGAGPGTVPRQGYDPQVTTLRQREITKAAELRDAGHAVPLRTLQRLRQRYETQGVWGLAGQRRARGQSLAGRVDERVADAVQRAVAEQVGRSTGTVDPAAPDRAAPGGGGAASGSTGSPSWPAVPCQSWNTRSPARTARTAALPGPGPARLTCRLCSPPSAATPRTAGCRSPH